MFMFLKNVCHVDSRKIYDHLWRLTGIQTMKWSQLFLWRWLERLPSSDMTPVSSVLFHILIHNCTVLKDTAIVSSCPVIFASLLKCLIGEWICCSRNWDAGVILVVIMPFAVYYLNVCKGLQSACFYRASMQLIQWSRPPNRRELSSLAYMSRHCLAAEWEIAPLWLLWKLSSASLLKRQIQRKERIYPHRTKKTTKSLLFFRGSF